MQDARPKFWCCWTDSTQCTSNGAEASLMLQIFFFFLGLVIIGIGVMTSSLEGSSFQVGNGDTGDGGLPYRSAPVTLRICSMHLEAAHGTTIRPLHNWASYAQTF